MATSFIPAAVLSHSSSWTFVMAHFQGARGGFHASEKVTTVNPKTFGSLQRQDYFTTRPSHAAS